MPRPAGLKADDPSNWSVSDASPERGGGVVGRQTPSVEDDADSTPYMMRQFSLTLSAQECVLKDLMNEMGTRLKTCNEDLVASMRVQLQEVKHAIMERLDGQERQISAVHGDVLNLCEPCLATVQEKDDECIPPLEGKVMDWWRQRTPESALEEEAQVDRFGRGQEKDIENQLLTKDSEKPTPSECPTPEYSRSTGDDVEEERAPSRTPRSGQNEAESNPFLDMQKNAPQAELRNDWTREVTPHHDLDAADEHLRNASKEFSMRQRTMETSLEDSVAPRTPTKLQIFVKSTAFESFWLVVILSNAVFVGFQTDLASTGSEEQEGAAMLSISLAYMLLFSVELGLRMYASGWHYLVSRSNWQWNYLDIFTVLTSVLECGLGLLIQFGGDSLKVQGVSQFRVLRMLRLVRLVRGLKVARVVRFVRALRILVHQIMFTLKSMVWAMLLLLIIIYLFAVIFTQGASNYRADESGWMLDHETDEGLIKYWSSLPRSMFTLFKSITGGVSWEEATYALSWMGGSWVTLFILYVCFAQMTVLNVITGYFCQNAIEGAALDPDLVAQKVIASKKMYVDKLTEIFSAMDADRSGSITLQEFEEHLESESTRAYFDSLGIDASDVWTLFKLMDADSGHEIDLQEFVDGCMRLSGGAKSLDLAKLAYDHKYLVNRLGKFMVRTDQTLSQLANPRAHFSQRAC